MLGILRRIRRSLIEEGQLRKYLIYALGEILLVVSGILIALAINAWYQGRLDAEKEQEYLSLLSRDILNTLANIEIQATYEAEQKERSLDMYRAISSANIPENTDSLSIVMAMLGGRRTLTLKNPTYQDLLNTGNLQLISNGALRDKIVEFYEAMELSFEIINKNNSTFVDDGYNRVVMGSGLIFPQFKGSVGPTALGNDQLFRELEGGYIEEENLLWQIPRESQEWNKVKSALLSRLRTAIVASSICHRLLDELTALKDAVELERKVE